MVFVCVRTIGSWPVAVVVLSDAALTVGPVRPSENAVPPMASTPTNVAAMSVAERLFTVRLLVYGVLENQRRARLASGRETRG
jgi:hypothetical protein